MKIAKIILFSLFGLMFINSGLNHFFHYIPTPPMEGEMKTIMDAFMTIKWLMPVVCFVEILAGVLIIIPKTRALGAIMVFPLMVGIVCHHLTLMPTGLPIVLVMLLVNLLMIADNWNKYKPMISA